MGRNRSGDKGGSGGGMGPSAYSPPIDHYRRQIGRQDSKKEKRNQRRIAQEHDAKEMAPKVVQQSVRRRPRFKKTMHGTLGFFFQILIVLTVVGVGAALYAMLYYSIGRS